MMLQLALEPKNDEIFKVELYIGKICLSAQEAILTTYICKLSIVDCYLLDYGQYIKLTATGESCD